MIALYSIVITLEVILAIMIMEGTKKATSRENESKVDFTLEPIDCNKIANDFVIQVKIIPPRKIRIQ